MLSRRCCHSTGCWPRGTSYSIVAQLTAAVSASWELQILGPTTFGGGCLWHQHQCGTSSCCNQAAATGQLQQQLHDDRSSQESFAGEVWCQQLLQPDSCDRAAAAAAPRRSTFTGELCWRGVAAAAAATEQLRHGSCSSGCVLIDLETGELRCATTSPMERFQPRLNLTLFLQLSPPGAAVPASWSVCEAAPLVRSILEHFRVCNG